MFISLSYTVQAQEKSFKNLDSSTLSLIQSKCLRCHGEIKNDRQKIKGDFDLSKIMKKGVEFKHSDQWAKVLDQLEKQTMPPEDTKELKGEDRKRMIDFLYKKLNKKHIEKRLLTSREIAHSMSDIFKYDYDVYDPFEKLHFITNIDSRYPTINSSSLLNTNFIKAIEFGMDEVVNRFVLPESKNIKAKKAINPGESYRAYVKYNSGYVITNQEYIDKLSRFMKGGTRGRTLNAAIKAEKKRILNLRTDDEERLSILEDSNRERAVKYNFPKGKYRISFKATALNRKLIQENYQRLHALKRPTKDQRGQIRTLDVWERLRHEKARLDFYHGGSQDGGLLAQGSKSGKLLKSFVIEDNKEKNYSFDFELRSPSIISIKFENGPKGGAVWKLSLGDIKKQSNVGMNYGLPCIRIIGDVIIKKIENINQRNDFDLSNIGIEKITEEYVKNKIHNFIKELSLENNSSRLMGIYDLLPKQLSIIERYELALMWIVNSEDHLYVDFNGGKSGDAARYVSYALLKQKPSEAFEKYYNLFKTKKITGSAFASKIVESKQFNNFLDEFTHYWLQQEVVLDKRKFNSVQRSLPFRKETSVYLRNIFAGNRPVHEIFNSNYKIVNSSLAKHYDLDDYSKFDRYEFSIIQNELGGILNQGSFFISQSSGVDPLPFKRAAWILENVFDHKLSEPPSDVDELSEGDSQAEVKMPKTFKEKVAMHLGDKSGACYSCHKVLDPVAFAMNNFSTMGMIAKEFEKAPLDNLRERITSEKKVLASAFTKQLISYIVGRNTNVYDKKIIQLIVKKTENNGYRVRDIFTEIISTYFR